MLYLWRVHNAVGNPSRHSTLPNHTKTHSKHTANTHTHTHTYTRTHTRVHIGRDLTRSPKQVNKKVSILELEHNDQDPLVPKLPFPSHSACPTCYKSETAVHPVQTFDPANVFLLDVRA